MAEGVGCVVDSENGSFHSQTTQRLPRKASQAAISAWKPLCAKKSPRGDPREIRHRDFNSFVALSAIEAAVLLFVMLIRINLLARCMDRFPQLAGLPFEISLHKEVSMQILLLE